METENEHEACDDRTKELEEKIEALNEYITDLQEALNEIYSIAKKF